VVSDSLCDIAGGGSEQSKIRRLVRKHTQGQE
jgi:hypothetical protein